MNVDPDQLPADKMWIEHPNDDNRRAWDRVVEAVLNAALSSEILSSAVVESNYSGYATDRVGVEGFVCVHRLAQEIKSSALTAP